MKQSILMYYAFPSPHGIVPPDMPEHPLGAPMVSSEGPCAAYYHYGRFRLGGETVEANRFS